MPQSKLWPKLQGSRSGATGQGGTERGLQGISRVRQGAQDTNWFFFYYYFYFLREFFQLQQATLFLEQCTIADMQSADIVQAAHKLHAPLHCQGYRGPHWPWRSCRAHGCAGSNPPQVQRRRLRALQPLPASLLLPLKYSAGGRGEMDEGGQKVQTSRYQVNPGSTF